MPVYEADPTNPQVALDAARLTPGSHVIFLPGLAYPIAERLRVFSDTRITAHGAYIHAVNGNHRLLANFEETDSFAGYEGNSDIAVEGGVWDCKAHEDQSDDVANAMNFIHCRSVRVRDITVLNVHGAHAVELAAVWNAWVSDCEFRGFHDPGGREFSEAIQLDWPKSPASTAIGLWDSTPCVGITINRCVMGASEDLGAFGALVGSHGAIPTLRHRRVAVTGCEVEESLSYGIRAWGWQDVVISDNRISETAGSSVLIQHTDAFTATGNVVREAGRNGFNLGGSSRGVVTGNTVALTVDQNGIWLGQVDGAGAATFDTLVADNLVSDANDNAIRIAAGCSRNVVVQNVLRRGATGGTTGVVNASGNTTNEVTRNNFHGFTINVS